MPYIEKKLRSVFDEDLESIAMQIDSKGELTYCLYKLCKLVIDKKELRYTNISEVISSCNDASYELRRKILDPYEDKMEKKHGKIYVRHEWQNIKKEI